MIAIIRPEYNNQILFKHDYEYEDENDDDDAYGDGADEDDEDVLILNGLSPPLPLSASVSNKWVKLGHVRLTNLTR